MKVVVSAPGKVHLMGEHAVVYGKPAILAAVSQRLYITVISDKRQVISKQSLHEARKKDAYLDFICDVVEKHCNTKIPNASINISSTIPKGRGMGSSAAFATAVIGALLTALNKPWDVQLINELAFKAEIFQHGTPSGGDNTVISYGGLLWYRREFAFLKTFWSLPFKIPKTFSPFVLIDTGKPKESTKEMVEKVQRSIFNFQFSIFNKIEDETKKFLQAVHDENENGVKDAMRRNEELLEDLDLVSAQTKKLIRAIEEVGGVAKISGAGGAIRGSGIVLCMHKDLKKIQDIASTFGFPVLSTKLGEPGVRMEHMIV